MWATGTDRERVKPTTLNVQVCPTSLSHILNLPVCALLLIFCLRPVQSPARLDGQLRAQQHVQMW